MPTTPPFQTNPFCKIYVYELHRLSYLVGTNAQALFALTEPGPYDAKVDHQIEERISAVIIGAARVHELLTAGSRQRSESARRFDFRVARAEYLAGLVRGLTISEINNRAVRNSLEHFDEGLDDTALKISDLYNKLGNPKTGLEIIATSSLCVWKLDQAKSDLPLQLVKVVSLEASRPILPVRIYEASERTYYNMGTSISVGKLASECGQIDELLRKQGSDVRDYPASFVAL